MASGTKISDNQLLQSCKSKSTPNIKASNSEQMEFTSQMSGKRANTPSYMRQTSSTTLKQSQQQNKTSPNQPLSKKPKEDINHPHHQHQQPQQQHHHHQQQQQQQHHHQQQNHHQQQPQQQHHHQQQPNSSYANATSTNITNNSNKPTPANKQKYLQHIDEQQKTFAIIQLSNDTITNKTHQQIFDLIKTELIKIIKTPNLIKGLYSISRNKWIVGTQNEQTTLLIEQAFDTQHIKVNRRDSRKLITIEIDQIIPDEALTEFFTQFGRVTKIKSKINPETGWYIGKKFFHITPNQNFINMPSKTNMLGYPLTIHYKDQIKQCQHCGQIHINTIPCEEQKAKQQIYQQNQYNKSSTVTPQNQNQPQNATLEQQNNLPHEQPQTTQNTTQNTTTQIIESTNNKSKNLSDLIQEDMDTQATIPSPSIKPKSSPLSAPHKKSPEDIDSSSVSYSEPPGITSKNYKERSPIKAKLIKSPRENLKKHTKQTS